MSKKIYTKSIRKHIRVEKMRIQKMYMKKEDQKNAIKALYDRLQKGGIRKS